MRLILGLLVLVALVSSRQAVAFDVSPEDFVVDDEGRAFRVAFTPHERLRCETGTTAARHQNPSTPVECAWHFRIALDFDDEAVFWRFRHVAFRSRLVGRTLQTTLMEGTYHRHDDSSFVLVPGPNWRVPAPFDLLIQYRLAGAELGYGGSFRLQSIDVLDAALLADFLRDPEFRAHAAFGVAGVLEIDEVRPFVASMMPFTGLRAHLEWEARDGRFAAALTATCGWSSTIPTIDWRPGCEASSEVEWIPLAVNDLPLSLVLRSEVTSTGPDWQVGASLRLSVPTE